MGINRNFSFFVLLALAPCLWTAPVLAATLFEGIVKPIHEVELAFPLDGVISHIFVKEGARVKVGDKIIQLDDSLQRLEVSRREAIYLDRSEIEANKKSLPILKGQYEVAQELHRESAAVSRDEMQNLEMQYYTLSGRIEVAEARKQQEGIEFEISREMLARYVLAMPINGVVTEIRNEVGEWAKSGATIVTAVDTSKCYIEFNVDEKYAQSLKVDQSIPLQVAEGNDLSPKNGKIVYVAPVADNASALVRVKVEFDNKNGKTIPGVLGQVEFK